MARSPSAGMVLACRRGAVLGIKKLAGTRKLLARTTKLREFVSQTLCVARPAGSEGEPDGPHETALAPSRRVCPTPGQGSARSGPRIIGHEHQCRELSFFGIVLACHDPTDSLRFLVLALAFLPFLTFVTEAPPVEEPRTNSADGGEQTTNKEVPTNAGPTR